MSTLKSVVSGPANVVGGIVALSPWLAPGSGQCPLWGAPLTVVPTWAYAAAHSAALYTTQEHKTNQPTKFLGDQIPSHARSAGNSALVLKPKGSQNPGQLLPS